jgi:hypothetical protein
VAVAGRSNATRNSGRDHAISPITRGSAAEELNTAVTPSPRLGGFGAAQIRLRGVLPPMIRSTPDADADSDGPAARVPNPSRGGPAMGSSPGSQGADDLPAGHRWLAGRWSAAAASAAGQECRPPDGWGDPIACAGNAMVLGRSPESVEDRLLCRARLPALLWAEAHVFYGGAPCAEQPPDLSFAWMPGRTGAAIRLGARPPCCRPHLCMGTAPARFQTR